MNILKELYTKGVDPDLSVEAISLMRKEALAEGYTNHDFDKALGIVPFDTSSFQEWMVDKAREVYGEDGGKFTREVFTLDDFLQAGFEQSVVSLAVQPQSTEAKKAANLEKSVIQEGAQALGTVTGDLPAYAGGFLLGTAAGLKTGPGAVVTGFAGSFAMPAILRTVMMDAYENGDIDSFSRFWDLFVQTTWEGAKGWLTGAATGGARLAITPIANKLPGVFLGNTLTTGTEIATFTTVGAALEGRVPEPKEFVVGAIAIGGLKAGAKIAKGAQNSYRSVRDNLQNLYASNGRRPLEVMEDMGQAHTIKEDLNSINIETPREYQTKGQAEKAADMSADSLSRETIEFKKTNEEWSMSEPIEAFGELSVENMTKTLHTSEFLEGTYNRLLAEHGLDTLHTSERTLIKQWTESATGDITRLDHLFVPLNEPLVIYHGSTTKGLNKQVSGSLNPDVAFARADKSYGEVYRIVLPSGTRVAFPSKSTVTGALNELEVVIHPENRIEIVRDLDLAEPAEGLLAGAGPEDVRIETVADPSRRAFMKQTGAALATAAVKKIIPLSELVPLPAETVAKETSIINLIPRDSADGMLNPLFVPRSTAIKEISSLGLSEKNLEVYTFHKDSAVKTWEGLRESLDQTSMRDYGRDIIVITDKNEILVDRVKNNKEYEKAVEEGNEYEDYIEPKYIDKGFEVLEQNDILFNNSIKEAIEHINFEAEGTESIKVGITEGRPKRELIEELVDELEGNVGLTADYAKSIAESIYLEAEARLAGAGPEDVQLEAPALEAPALEAPKLNVQRIGDAKVVRREATTEVSEQISVGEPSGPKRKYGFNEIYRDLWDDLHPLNQVVKAITDGKKIPANTDPYILARNLKGVSGVGDHFLEFGALDFATKTPIGEPLRDIIRPIDRKGKLQEFREYIISRRVLELERKSPPIETGIDPVMAAEVVKKGNAKFDAPFLRLREYQTKLLEYVRDSGLLSLEQFEVMQEANKDFVPFHRVMDPGKSGGSGMRSGKPTSLKKMRGSTRRIIDPIESIMRNTYVLTTLAERNRVMNAVVELAETRPDLNYIAKKKAATVATKIKSKELQKLLEPYLKDESIRMSEEDVTVFRKKVFINDTNLIRFKDGKPEVYEVDPMLIEALGAMDRATLDATVKILALPATMLRTGAVLSPEFMGRNAVRDTIQASIYSKDGFIPVISTLNGLGHVLGRTKAYREWVANGGQFAHLQSIDRAYHQKGMKELLQSVPVRNVLKNPIELLRAMSGLVEQSTRVEVFRQRAKKAQKKRKWLGLRKGEDKPRIEALTDAAFESRDVTLDFQKFGAKTRSLNAMSAFFNAWMQGQQKIVSNFKNRPVAMTAKVFAGLVIPSATLYIINRKEEWYKDLAQWEKDLYWHVEAFGTIWRFPKPFELGLIFGTGTERFMEWLLKDDPKAADEFLWSLGKAVVPNLMPQALGVPLEVWANKSIFLNRPIIPRDREGMLPPYQYSLYTSETARVIGALVGTLPIVGKTKAAAPAVVEHVIRGWTGGLGKHALDLMDKVLVKSGLSPDVVEPTPTYLTNIPLIKAFVTRYPSMNTKPIERFYKEYNRREKIINSYKKLLQEGRIGEAQRVFKFGADTGSIIRLTGIKTAISNQSNMIRKIHRMQSMDGMTKQQVADWKREQIDVLYYQINSLAKMGLEVVKAIKTKVD